MYYKKQLLKFIDDSIFTEDEKKLFIEKNDSYCLKNDIESVLKDEELQPLFEKLRNNSLYDSYNEFIKKMSKYKINTEPTDPIVDDTISIVH